MKKIDIFDLIIFACVTLFVFLLVGSIIPGCSLTERQKAKDNHPVSSDLSERAEFYCDTSRFLENDIGWVGHCGDQVLFNSLRVVSCPNVKTNIFAAANPNKPGEWHRDGKRECYDMRETATPFSRDMLLGLMVYLYTLGDDRALEATNDLISYLKSHNWYLCEAPEPVRTSRCKMNPNLIATLYELVYRLGGEDNQLRKVPHVEVSTNKGYRAHLTVLHILIRGLMKGSISGLNKEVLRSYKNREPRNLFFRAVYAKFDDGNVKEIVDELLAMPEFPVDKLPSTDQRCEPYIWQRDQNSDSWLPCKKQLVHPGVDFTFLEALVHDRLRHNILFTVPEGEFGYQGRDR